MGDFEFVDDVPNSGQMKILYNLVNAGLFAQLALSKSHNGGGKDNDTYDADVYDDSYGGGYGKDDYGYGGGKDGHGDMSKALYKACKNHCACDGAGYGDSYGDDYYGDDKYEDEAYNRKRRSLRVRRGGHLDAQYGGAGCEVL